MLQSITDKQVWREVLQDNFDEKLKENLQTRKEDERNEKSKHV